MRRRSCTAYSRPRRLPRLEFLEDRRVLAGLVPTLPDPAPVTLTVIITVTPRPEQPTVMTQITLQVERNPGSDSRDASTPTEESGRDDSLRSPEESGASTAAPNNHSTRTRPAARPEAAFGSVETTAFRANDASNPSVAASDAVARQAVLGGAIGNRPQLTLLGLPRADVLSSPVLPSLADGRLVSLLALDRVENEPGLPVPPPGEQLLDVNRLLAGNPPRGVGLPSLAALSGGAHGLAEANERVAAEEERPVPRSGRENVPPADVPLPEEAAPRPEVEDVAPALFEWALGDLLDQLSAAAGDLMRMLAEQRLEPWAAGLTLAGAALVGPRVAGTTETQRRRTARQRWLS